MHVPEGSLYSTSMTVWNLPSQHVLNEDELGIMFLRPGTIWQPQVRKIMKNIRAGFSLAVLATAILLLLQTVVLARAQDQDQGYDQDPPTRAGRISFVQGSVSFQPGGEGDWVEASQNRTLTVGDNLWVDRDSRAELQIGSTSIRLAPQTSISFLDVKNEVTQIRLSVGSVYARVRRAG